MLDRGDVRADMKVIHLRYGLGRVVSHSPLGEPAVSVTVSFGGGLATVMVPDRQLFRAEISPVELGGTVPSES